MFFIGIILIITSTFLTMINSTFVYSNLSDLINIFDYAYDELFLFFAFLSGTIVKFIFCVIIQHFSPNIFVLTNVISSIITWIYNLCKKSDTTTNIVCLSIGYFIILLSCLIYNEIVILNFFKLNENTNFQIKERIEFDIKVSENINLLELNDIGDYYIKDDNRITKGENDERKSE